MGIRMDQHQGLTTEALVFLNEHAKKEVSIACSNCFHPIEFKKICVPYSKYDGICENEYDLFQYSLKDGGIAREVVQCSPWSSGPIFFLKLEVYNAMNVLMQVFEWSQEEIDVLV